MKRPKKQTAEIIRYITGHFDLPEIHTSATLDPEGFQHWRDRNRQVVSRYNLSA